MRRVRSESRTVRSVFQITTLNGAWSTGMGEEFGAIEPGKRANLILFERDPLRDPRAILGPKTVVKDGVEWRR
jgi:imidazolonepropionase-like amidohydrolase